MDPFTVQLAECCVLAAVVALACGAWLSGQVAGLRGRVEFLERAVIEKPRAAAGPPRAARLPEAREPERFADEHAPCEAPVTPDPSGPAEARRPTIDWEMFAGGRMLNLVGGLVLVIGIALALKYAFDQDWISQSMRIAAGLVAGGALVAVGEILRTRKSRRWFAQGLTGTGLGVLYVCGYAAFDGYHLWPFTVAYAFMSCVTVVAFALALRSDSLAVALLGWAGGFATPFVMNGGSSNEIGLASYVVLLDLGLVAISLAKGRWFALEPLALAASYATAFSWNASNPNATPAVSTIALLGIWGAFFAADAVRALRFGSGASGRRAALGVVNLYLTCAFLSSVLALEHAAFERIALSLAACYALAYAALRKRDGDATTLRVQWYLSAVALSVVAISLRFGWFEAATILAAENWLLAALERALRRNATGLRVPEVSLGAAALIAASASGILAAPSALVHSDVWSVAFGSRDVALAALILTAYGVDRLLRGSPAWPEAAGIALRQLGMLGVLTFLALHTEGYRLAAAYAVAGFAVLVAGARGMYRDLEIDGLVATGLGLALALARPDTSHLERIFAFVPLANQRFEAFAVLTAALLGGAEVLRRRSLLPGAVWRFVRAAGLLTAVGALTLDVRDGFERALAEARLETQTPAVVLHLAQLSGAAELAISATWIGASLALIALGIRLRIRDLRLLAIALFDLTILKAFFVDLGSMETVYRIAAFLGLGLVLLAVSYVYQRLEGGFFPGRPKQLDERAA